MREREQFFAWLPFYVNGTLEAAQHSWMQSYLESHAALAPEVELHRQLRSGLRETVTASVRDVPVDVGYARVARASPKPRRHTRAWPLGAGGGTWPNQCANRCANGCANPRARRRGAPPPRSRCWWWSASSPRC
ncbi:MAG TPA: hypothetical protein VFR86_24340 [Burkholderiaceae bacterium]|nr:hypothetical protein [Burkholderiaceae bacterium]